MFKMVLGIALCLIAAILGAGASLYTATQAKIDKLEARPVAYVAHCHKPFNPKKEVYVGPLIRTGLIVSDRTRYSQ